MMRRPGQAIVGVVIAAGVVTGCLGGESDGTDSNTSWAECRTDTDCFEGEICVDERCTTRVGSSNPDAGSDFRPLDTTSPLGQPPIDECENPSRSCAELGARLDELLSATDTGQDLGFGAGDLTVLVVFDRSGSMSLNWEQPSRWQAASDALLMSMALNVDNLTVGAILFPDATECGVQPITDVSQVDFVPGREFVMRWVEGACANQPTGNTPMEAAFAEADVAIGAARDLGLLDERFRVIVVADGQPNCDSNPAALVSHAAAWLEQGVETWVIGLPGSQDATALLDDIAAAGGTGAHRAPVDLCELRADLGIAVR